MDRPITKKKKQLRPMVYIVLFLGVGVLAYSSIDINSSGDSLRVDADNIEVGEVELREIQEYIPVSATVLAKKSVFLDLKAGGTIEEVAVASGKAVEKGELIVRISNPVLQKENIDSETILLQNLDQLKASQYNIVNSSLKLKEEIAQVEYELKTVSNKFERYIKITKSNLKLVSQEEFENTQNEMIYLKQRRELLNNRQQQEDIINQQQLSQITTSIAKITESMDVLEEIKDSFKIRAPISGVLSAMDAEIGQHFDQGARIGQIDQLDSLKLRADIDQYYVSRVSVGQSGTFILNNKAYQVVVDKVFPEVKNSAFQVDMSFVEAVHDDVKRGQTVQLKLALNAPTVAKVITKGSFYNFTNGRWVYRISKDGSGAEKVFISTGKQNPSDVEVVQGLDIGDRVITSNYEGFSEVERLAFSSSIN